MSTPRGGLAWIETHLRLLLSVHGEPSSPRPRGSRGPPHTEPTRVVGGCWRRTGRDLGLDLAQRPWRLCHFPPPDLGHIT